MRMLSEVCAFRRRPKRLTVFRRKTKHVALNEQTTGSEGSLEDGELVEVQQSFPLPKEELLRAVRTLYDLTFRQRYRDDVLLCSLSLFKKYIRMGRLAATTVVLAACFHLSAQLLENHPPSYSELVSLCLYQFTRDKLAEIESELLIATQFDITCNFSDNIRAQLREQLRQMSIRVIDDQPHLLIFSNF